MKKLTWRKHHKWVGLIFCFFLIMFCISGILLNHRSQISRFDIGRDILPADYQYKNWNNGLLRGSIALDDHDGKSQSVLIYGNGGVWRTDRAASHFTDFNSGLPAGADNKAVRGVVQTPNGNLFLITAFGAYRYRHHQGHWTKMTLPSDERLSDITHRGDSLVIVGRSHLYVATAPYDSFTEITLKEPANYSNRVTLFRTVWLIHSGEIFGTAGKLVVDIIAAVLIALCATGIMCWLLPKRIRKVNSIGGDPSSLRSKLRWNYRWHDLIGRKTIVLTVFVSITGWCLRPPLMIPLALSKVSPIPFSELDSPNPWNDRLRMLRFDDEYSDWLLSTSEGFYRLDQLNSVPNKIGVQPPVSVMGVNVLQKNHNNEWLVGSFSGMYRWNRANDTIFDYFSNKPAPKESGMPFGSNSISGYSDDFNTGPFAVDYSKGTSSIVQPNDFKKLRMSLWNLSLEVHTGRIYTLLGPVTALFVFLSGCFVLWILISGWKIRKQ